MADIELDPDVEHPGLADDDWVINATKISDYARNLGMHGVMILSPRCPGCGMLHDWHMLTDTPEGQSTDVADLLTHYGDVVRNTAPRHFVPKAAN